MSFRERDGPEQKKKEAPTLKEFAPKFLENYAKADRHKPSGVASKESILRIHLVPVLGSQKLDSITNSKVQQLKLHLQDKSPKTVNNVLATLSVLLKNAVEWELITHLPCAIRLLPVERQDAAFHDFDAYEKLLEASRSIDYRTYVIALLGGEGGFACRRDRGVGVDRYRPRTTASQRASLRLERPADESEERPRPVRGDDRAGSDGSPQASAPSQFTGAVPGRREADHPARRRSRVRYAAIRAKVPTGVHILRHTFCSHLVMRGAAMRAVQKLVGHQDLTMTQRYAHLSPAALIDTVRLLESRVAQSGSEENWRRRKAARQWSRASRRRATAMEAGIRIVSEVIF